MLRTNDPKRRAQYALLKYALLITRRRGLIIPLPLSLLSPADTLSLVRAQVGNLGHALLFFYAVVFVNLAQFMGGIVIANREDDTAGSVNSSVPAWSFAAVIQPTLTFLVYLHSYGNLNLAIERDVDQDVSRPSAFVHTVLVANTRCRSWR